MNKLIATIKLASGPKAIGPYSVGKIFNGMAYLSGQIGFNPETGTLVSESIEDQTHQIMKNVTALLNEANSNLESIIKCTVYLTDMADFQKVNTAYGSYFKEDPPARVCIAVKELPAKAKIEIEVIAAVNNPKL